MTASILQFKSAQFQRKKKELPQDAIVTALSRSIKCVRNAGDPRIKREIFTSV